MSNPWTEMQLANDVHAGDPREAAMIRAENGNEPPMTCGVCGGPAHYKHTIGVNKCVRCGSLYLGGKWG